MLASSPINDSQKSSSFSSDADEGDLIASEEVLNMPEAQEESVPEILAQIEPMETIEDESNPMHSALIINHSFRYSPDITESKEDPFGPYADTSIFNGNFIEDDRNSQIKIEEESCDHPSSERGANHIAQVCTLCGNMVQRCNETMASSIICKYTCDCELKRELKEFADGTKYYECVTCGWRSESVIKSPTKFKFDYMISKMNLNISQSLESNQIIYNDIQQKLNVLLNIKNKNKQINQEIQQHLKDQMEVMEMIENCKKHLETEDLIFSIPDIGPVFNFESINNSNNMSDNISEINTPIVARRINFNDTINRVENHNAEIIPETPQEELRGGMLPFQQIMISRSERKRKLKRNLNQMLESDYNENDSGKN